MDTKIQDALRRLPAVDEILRQLEQAQGQAPAPPLPRWALRQAVREEIEALRRRVLAGQEETPALDAGAVQRRAAALRAPSLRPVINATGVVLHTNLGRAPLGQGVLERIIKVASGYSTLEYDLAARRRGSRHVHVAEILRQLSGAEDAVVVNNNAAAVLLCLSALAQGREVVVSRGELIEIGGSFRLPDVMKASGALLREVGTTNRTHLRDYQAAIGEATGLLLKAHRSNFAVVGFTAEVDPRELVQLGREQGVPTLFDLGSGSLLDLRSLGLPAEDTVQEAVAAGFDLVTFSGDKVLGGPQAGIIVGRAEQVARVRSHPLMRPLRPDKMTLAGLEATLEAYRDGLALEQVPALAMLAASPAVLRRRAVRVRSRLARRALRGFAFEVVEVASKVGGGALPQAAPRSFAIAVSHSALGVDAIEGLLRRGAPPVIAHIEEGRLLLDLRTVREEQLAELVDAVAGALQPAG